VKALGQGHYQNQACTQLFPRVKPEVKGITKIRPALDYPLMCSYFGNELYPTLSVVGWFPSLWVNLSSPPYCNLLFPKRRLWVPTYWRLPICYFYSLVWGVYYFAPKVFFFFLFLGVVCGGSHFDSSAPIGKV
jgi:hypothetical protein